jgi:hypothetical protein
VVAAATTCTAACGTVRIQKLVSGILGIPIPADPEQPSREVLRPSLASASQKKSVDREDQSANGAMKFEASGAQSSGLTLQVDVFIVIPQMGMVLRKAGFLMTHLESPTKCKLLINSNLRQQMSRLAFDLLYRGIDYP